MKADQKGEASPTVARQMLTFERDNRRFGLRVVGIALHEGRVLLHRAEQDDFWALPGGRVEMLEPSATALQREMEEELEVTVQVERLVWVLENFFEYRGKHFHELGLYYLMSLPEQSPLLEHRDPFIGDEEGMRLIFQWFPVDTLQGVRLYPSFLRHALAELPASTAHLVHRDE